MTKEEIVNDMRRVLEDMRKYDGLPPNLSTEAQLLNGKLLSPPTALCFLLKYRTGGRIASPYHDSVAGFGTFLSPMSGTGCLPQP